LEKIGITVSKGSNFSEWYTQVVLKAELADYAPVKGLIVLRPDGYAIWELVQRTVDAKFAADGIRNGFLPVLIPESLLGKEKKHFAGFNPEVFWVTHSGESKIGDRLALRPTSETLAYSMYSKWIKSWRDLPLKINFWNTALRAEIKGTKPFLRTSEFLWQEGHTVHATGGEAQEQVARMLDVYLEVVEQEMAIPAVAGKKSESEKFVGAVYTTTVESMMPDGKALQMGTSHFLGQNFSVPFGVKFADRDNKEQFAWQTSWGVSWRLIGAMIMVHGDDHGLSLPPRMAPIQVVVVPVYFTKEQEAAVTDRAREVGRMLCEGGIRAHTDDRQEMTPGFKYHDWEMRGVPLRIEIGPRELKDDRIRVTQRYNRAKSDVAIPDAGRIIPEMLEEIQSGMRDRARKALEEMTHAVSDYAAFRSMIEGGGFFRMPWCGGPDCEKKIKEETGADIRVIPFDGQDAPGICVYCGEPAVCTAMFARGY
jgi:prolyl-tRNA synthetase